MKKFFKILMVFALLGGATLSCTKDYSQEVVDLKAQDENLKALITSLQSTISQLDQTIKTLDANKVDKTVFEAAKAELEAQLKKLEEKHDADIAAVQEKIKTLDAAILALQAALDKNVEDLNAVIKALGERHDDDVKRLEAQLAALFESVEKNIQDISVLKQEVKDLNDNLRELSNRVDVYYQELSGKIAALAGRIQSIVADAPVDANEVSTLVWGEAPVLAANESAANSPAFQTITHVHMTFTIVPKECAEALNKENVKLVVTEGLDVTRAQQADLNKEYVPAQVDVNKTTGQVTVHANINPKRDVNGGSNSNEHAYWVALKVYGDDGNVEYQKMSQFVKATENEEEYILFNHVSWFRNGSKQTGGVQEITVAMPWQNNVENGNPVETLNAMTYSESDIFGKYELRFIMPGGSSMSAAETGALFGIRDVNVVPSGVSTKWTGADGNPATDPLDKILTFKKTGNVVDFNAAFLLGSTTAQNREYVGSQAVYQYGVNEGNPEMTVGGYKLPGYGLKYTAKIIGNTVHADATPDKLDYKWDYVHFNRTVPTCHVAKNCTWNFTQMPLETAVANWRITDSIYIQNTERFFGGRQAGVTTARIDKVAQDLFNFTLDSIPFTTGTQYLYAAYHKIDKNAAQVPYTTYSTEIPFTIGPRHANVETKLSATTTPNLTQGGTVDCDVLDAAFSDYDDTPEKWDGSHTTWGKAKLYNAFIAAISGGDWNPSKVTIGTGTTDQTGLHTAFALHPAFTGTSTITDDSWISYSAGTVSYGTTYNLTFTKTVFNVTFIFNVTLTTNPSPFTLVTTPYVNNDTIVVQGRSQAVENGEYQFTLEQIHFNKYLEVEASPSAPTDEDITLEFLPADGKRYRFSDSTSPINNNAYGVVDFSTIGTMDASDTPNTSGNYTFVENNNGVLDWNTMGVDAFKGRKLTVKATLKINNIAVDSRTLVIVPEEPILKLETKKEFDLDFTPGEDLVIDLYEALKVTGVYHSPEVESYAKELLYYSTYGTVGWRFHNHDVTTPSYAAQLPTISDASMWRAWINGQPWTITEGVQYTIDGNILTLKKDNNPGTFMLEIPVTLKSCLDCGAANFAEFEKISQYAVIKITAVRN